MIPKEILKQVRELEIRTRRTVNDILAGQYVSVFKGRGMEFDQVREYVPGDDVRAIDWNVTARFARPFIKEFVEERELTVLLLVDASASNAFGTAAREKRAIAAETAALLALSAIRNNDKVGLIEFTDRVEKYIPPKKGRLHALRVVREVLFFEPEGRRTNINEALKFLNRVARRRSVLFLISDFVDDGYGKSLGFAAHRHDLIAVRLLDPREEELLPAGLLRLADPETGEERLFDLSSRRVREWFRKTASERAAGLSRLFKKRGVDEIALRTDRSVVDALIEFFRMREARR